MKKIKKQKEITVKCSDKAIKSYIEVLLNQPYIKDFILNKINDFWMDYALYGKAELDITKEINHAKKMGLI